jgi:small GTP-binding protein
MTTNTTYINSLLSEIKHINIKKQSGFINNFNYQISICLLGDCNVGKTSILNRYTNNSFIIDHINTIGCDFKLVSLIINDSRIKIQIWDTSGQERFKSIATNYYRNAHSFMFVFDLTSYISFVNIKEWIETAYSVNKNHMNINILIGNKNDILNERMVDTKEVVEFAKINNLLYFETSAKENFMIDEVFSYMSYILIKELSKEKSSNETFFNNININNVNSIDSNEHIELKDKCNC